MEASEIPPFKPRDPNNAWMQWALQCNQTVIAFSGQVRASQAEISALKTIVATQNRIITQQQTQLDEQAKLIKKHRADAKDALSDVADHLDDRLFKVEKKILKDLEEQSSKRHCTTPIGPLPTIIWADPTKVFDDNWRDLLNPEQEIELSKI